MLGRGRTEIFRKWMRLVTIFWLRFSMPSLSTKTSISRYRESPKNFSGPTSLVAVLTARLSAEAMESWGWRVPFFAGSLIALVALAIRTQVRETPLFDELLSEGKTVRSPLREGLRRQWRAVLLTFAMAAFHALSYYLVVAFVPVYLVSFVKIDHAAAMRVGTVASAFNVAFIAIPASVSENRTKTRAYCRMHRVFTP